MLSVVVKDDLGSPINLSGYSITGAMKLAYSSGVAQVITGEVAHETSGVITLTLGSDATAALKVTEYIYGIEAYSSDNMMKILNGYVSVYPEVVI